MALLKFLQHHYLFLRSDKLSQHYEHLNIYMPLSISKLHLIQLKRQQKQFKNSLHLTLPHPMRPLRNKQRPLMQASAQPFQNALTKLGHYWGYPERETVKPMQSRVAVFPRHVFTSHHLFKATPFNLPIPHAPSPFKWILNAALPFTGRQRFYIQGLKFSPFKSPSSLCCM